MKVSEHAKKYRGMLSFGKTRDEVLRDTIQDLAKDMHEAILTAYPKGGKAVIAAIHSIDEHYERVITEIIGPKNGQTDAFSKVIARMIEEWMDSAPVVLKTRRMVEDHRNGRAVSRQEMDSAVKEGQAILARHGHERTGDDR